MDRLDLEPSSVCTSSRNHDRTELTPLYSSSPDTSTLRLIMGFFLFFTISLTTGLVIEIRYGKPQIIRHGSVTSDNEICSSVGASVIKQGGNAVDGAVAAAFCISVVSPHLTGLGSGGIMLIYSHRIRKVVDVINFQVKRSTSSSVGVPGFVAGLSLAHSLHGLLEWKALLVPAINIAKAGFLVPRSLLAAKSHLHHNSRQSERLSRWLSPLQSHMVLSVPEMAATLSFIANLGSAEFYNQTLREELFGLLDETDVVTYQPSRETAIYGRYKDFNLIVPGSGSGGPILLNALEDFQNSSTSSTVYFVEKFREMAAVWPYSSGSSIVAFDTDDLYVSLVSGIGSVLGSQLLTDSGYILNNLLEVTMDASLKPASLMTPVVAIHRERICGKRIALGAADVRDLSQVLPDILDNPSSNISSEIEAPRVAIYGTQVSLETLRTPALGENDLSRLIAGGYKTVAAQIPYSSINGIEKVNDNVTPYADSRGSGIAVSY